MSRNSERLGAQNINVEAPPQVAQETNNTDIFSFVVPTDFVELPSKGKFYPQNHPLHFQETVEVRHMTAKDEDILTSRALLKKGVALDRLLNNIIVNKNIKAENLLSGDRNAILIAARISGYGPDYTTQITCPACSSKQNYSFNLFDFELYTGSGLQPEEAVHKGNGIFSTTLPKTGLEIDFKLLTGTDEKKLVSLLENARKSKKQENTITTQLKSIIVSVNGVTDRKAIAQVVDNIPSMDARHLRTVSNLAAPNVDMGHHFECQSCDHEQELEVPLTADFFWPDR